VKDYLSVPTSNVVVFETLDTKREGDEVILKQKAKIQEE